MDHSLINTKYSVRPFLRALSYDFTNPGKCFAEQTEVKAPGNPKIIVFPPTVKSLMSFF